jgi:hypothetical protein
MNEQTKNEISEKINKLAAGVVRDGMLESFIKLTLEDRILGVAVLAAAVADYRTHYAAQELLSLI